MFAVGWNRLSADIRNISHDKIDLFLFFLERLRMSRHICHIDASKPTIVSISLQYYLPHIDFIVDLRFWATIISIIGLFYLKPILVP